MLDKVPPYRCAIYFVSYEKITYPMSKPEIQALIIIIN